MNELKALGFVILSLNEKKVVIPKKLAPRVVSGVKDINLDDAGIRKDRELGAVAGEEDKI